jgi:hypothetical protein
MQVLHSLKYNTGLTQPAIKYTYYTASNKIQVLHATSVRPTHLTTCNRQVVLYKNTSITSTVDSKSLTFPSPSDVRLIAYFSSGRVQNYSNLTSSGTWRRVYSRLSEMVAAFTCAVILETTFAKRMPFAWLHRAMEPLWTDVEATRSGVWSI